MAKISPIVNVNVTIQIAKIFRMIEMRSTIDFGARPSLFYLADMLRFSFMASRSRHFTLPAVSHPWIFFQVDVIRSPMQMT